MKHKTDLKQRFQKLNIFIVVILITLTFTSCGFCNIFSKQFYFENEGGVRPGKNRFEFRENPYVLQEHDLIKVNCVYQLKLIANSSEHKTQSSDSITNKYIRFFKNGRFLINKLISNKESHLEQYNNLKGGKVGYYQIIENELILEYFDVRLGGMSSDCGQYYKDKYKMTNIGIKLQSVRRSDNGIFYAWRTVENENWFYKKNIEGLTGETYW